MPAVLSALCSAIFAYFATIQAYGDSLYTIFPGMKNSTLVEDEHEMIIGVRAARKSLFDFSTKKIFSKFLMFLRVFMRFTGFYFARKIFYRATGDLQKNKLLINCWGFSSHSVLQLLVECSQVSSF